jgi:hypothetical protein
MIYVNFMEGGWKARASCEGCYKSLICEYELRGMCGRRETGGPFLIACRVETSDHMSLALIKTAHIIKHVSSVCVEVLLDWLYQLS